MGIWSSLAAVPQNLGFSRTALWEPRALRCGCLLREMGYKKKNIGRVVRSDAEKLKTFPEDSKEKEAWLAAGHCSWVLGACCMG